MLEKVKLFFTKKLWRAEFDHLSKPKIFLLQQLRVLVLAYRGFKEDNILLRSSALTFYTLISIVPIIAMAFGVAKGFGFDEKLNNIIQSYFSNQEQVSELLLKFSHSFLDNAKGGLIAGMGLILLFWSVMKVLGNIELCFNAVWGINTPRTLIRKFTEYLSIMLIAPVFIVFASGLTIFLSSATSDLLDQNNAFFLLGPVIRFLIKLSPYVLIWLLFAFLYVAIPNTKVKIKYALIAGIIAGSGFNLLEWAYFSFQIFAVKANAVYGSFAALPLFLVWVQSSWTIVLFGCEIAFAGQHVKRYEYEKEVNSISIAHKRKITLIVLLKLNHNFNSGQPAWSADQLCESLKLPVRLVQGILNELVTAEVLTEVTNEKLDSTRYTVARELNHFKISEIIALLEENGSDDIPVKNKELWESINNALVALQTELNKSDKNVKLQDLESLLKSNV